MRKGTARLDRKQPFAEVWGPSVHRYEQEGRLFGPDEIELIEDGSPAAPDPAAAVSDPNGVENQDLKAVSRKQLADRYHEVAGRRAGRGWNKTKLRDAILDALARG